MVRTLCRGEVVRLNARRVLVVEVRRGRVSEAVRVREGRPRGAPTYLAVQVKGGLPYWQ
jgi:hypothetical protein